MKYRPRTKGLTSSEIHSIFPETSKTEYDSFPDGRWEVPFPNKSDMDSAMAKVKELTTKSVKGLDFEPKCETVNPEGFS